MYFTHLAIEGRFFLQWLAEKDPEKYKDWKSFKFSESWKEGFAKRFNISLQVPTRGKKAMDPDDEKKAIAVFHANTRALQLTEPRRCKIYGHILAVYVFNRDQVPVKLMSQTLRTVHKKNSGTVQVITGSSNAAREASLDLKVPMELLVIDGKVVNFPKPTLVFHGTGHFKNKCMTTDTKILEEESKLWDPDVNVFFQKKGWVDGNVLIWDIRKTMTPIHERLVEDNQAAVFFEDNAPSHKTPRTRVFWEKEFPRSCYP